MSAASASSRERRIALIHPAAAADDQAALAMKLLDSVLWVFKGTTQSDWLLADAEAAQVVAVHHTESAQRLADWRKQGKLIVMVSTDAAVAPAAPGTLLYPFPTVQVLRLLAKLDAELDSDDLSVANANSIAPVGNDAAANSDSWSFLESLRTLRAVSNADVWLAAKNANGPILWLRGDGKQYRCAEPTARAIRTGKLRLNALTLQKGAAPPEALDAFPGSELAWFEGYNANATLAPWLNASATYRLLRWPDLGRMRHMDAVLRTEQIRIIAALENAPSTLVQLAERASTSLETACRVLNALSGCGLVDAIHVKEPKTIKTAATTPVPAGGLKQFLRSIRRHLGLGVSA